MKDVLRKLLNAEQAGQQAARAVPCRELVALPSLQRFKRARQEIPNDRLDLLRELSELSDAAFRGLSGRTT